jgi:ATP-dependent Clp protease adapter protein ClpS
MSQTASPDVIEREITDQDNSWVTPRKVVVHNCHCHTFQQVILGLTKSLPMGAEEAYEFATLIHLTGAAVVYEGELEKCELIANNIIAWAGPGNNEKKLPLRVTVEE